MRISRKIRVWAVTAVSALLMSGTVNASQVTIATIFTSDFGIPGAGNDIVEIAESHTTRIPPSFFGDIPAEPFPSHSPHDAVHPDKLSFKEIISDQVNSALESFSVPRSESSVPTAFLLVTSGLGLVGIVKRRRTQEE